MKELLKPGRILTEYLEEDGTLKKTCLTCINRVSKNTPWGDYLCAGGRELWNECVDMKKKIRKFWEPRVDPSNSFIKEEDMAL